MKTLLFAFPFLLFFSQNACRRSTVELGKEPALYMRFSPMSIADTLHFELPDEGTADAPGDTIPNPLFFGSLQPAWVDGIAHIADSTEAVVFARGRFPIANGYEGCLVEIRQFWFKHQSVLVYDKQRKVFTDRVTVAGWYGGEGGQVLSGSWCFDFDGDGSKDLLYREIEHSLVMQEAGEPLESTVERAMLLLWENGRFVATARSDSSALVKRFGINSPW